MRISDWSSDVCSSDLGAGAPHDVRELEGDVAAADQHDSPWQRLQVEKIVAGRQMLLAGNAERHRFGAGGEQDMAAFEHSCADGHRVATGEAGAAVVSIDALLSKADRKSTRLNSSH